MDAEDPSLRRPPVKGSARQFGSPRANPSRRHVRVPKPSLDAIRHDLEGVVILEGDWGYDVYVVIPVGAVRCSEDTLRQLLRDLDSLFWPANQLAGAHLVFESLPLGTQTGRNGLVTDDIWIGPLVESRGLGQAVRDVIVGRRARLS